ncbi:nitroreductase family protein [Candidatus Woesearchaeota archaeon]|nr:nitroreductase family protein [Candidatus Woesearchaeota archaeon]
MMEIGECIKTRRSVRKFLDKEIPDNIIEKLIDAARHAPFGGPPKKDCQLWEFIIVKSKEIKAKLALDYEDRQFVKQAPVVIVVCADKNKDPKYKNWDISTALAVENIILMSHNLGLGVCYVDTFNHHEGHKEDRKKLIKTLKLPENIELISIIPIGYPDESEQIKDKELREIKEMMHEDSY